MGFTLTLYKCNSDPKVVSKSLSGGITYNATLKHTCNVLNPVFIIDRGEHGYFNGYNYLYCAELNRYYFVDLSIETGGLMTLSCSIDVLMSYGGQIRGLNCFVERQENIYNPYASDPLMPIVNGSIIDARDVGAVGSATSRTMYLTCIGGIDS